MYQPVLILKEGSTRSTGREAMHRNILAAKVIAESLRTTLGPKGMDKMLVDSMGDVVISNDGATIMKEMEIEHPAAKMLEEVAKAQDNEVGDGTTTVVVLAGELLKQAESLLEQNVHPTTITSGYKLAAEKVNELIEKLAIHVSPDDVETLKKVAATSITGKAAEVARDKLAELAVEAVKAVYEGPGKKIDVDNIKVEKKAGGSVDDSILVRGMIIDKEVVHPGMPKRIENAKIALINAALEIEKTEIDARIQITSPEQMKAFMDEEDRMMKSMVDKIKASGANVVFCQKGIDDMVQHYMAKEGILAARRVKKSDMEKLARATGGKIVTNIDEIKPEELGVAGVVEERKIGEDKMTFVLDCKEPKSVSILIRGGSEHVVDEIERGLHDALCVVARALESEKLVPGGGAVETELALRLKEYASSVGGREQLAVQAFATALEIIPRSLAANAGLDPIDILVELRAQHERGNKTYGVNVFTGKVEDMVALGVLEPLQVKRNAIMSALEAANMILRIDDVIAAGKLEKEKAPKTPPSEEGETPETSTSSEFD